MTHRVPANDFRRLWNEIGKAATHAMARVGASSSFILGAEVRAFEPELAAAWGLPSAIGVASGLDALEISLRILGCGPGDKVLTTPVSAFASTLAILKLGAVPVFADTTDSGLLDLEHCRRILQRSPDIRFLLPVHLYGLVLNLDALRELSEEFGLRMVEDCAQSIHANWRGLPTGSVGQLAATSFYPTKNLGAMGDAGAILTADPTLDALAREFRDYGQASKFKHIHVGYNSRLDELQAAILRDACLPRLTAWTAQRQAVAARYREGLMNPEVRLAPLPPEASLSGHLFPVFVAPGRRAGLLQHLAAHGVQGSIHYPVAIPDQPAMEGQRHEIPDGCDRARQVCAGVVSLPIHPYLTAADVAYVIQVVNDWG